MQDDEASVLDMLQAARDAVGYAGSDKETYLADNMRQFAVERVLEIVGEAARRISEEYKAAHPDVPWQPREVGPLRRR